MPDASNQTYSPNDLSDWSTDPRETDAALDELAQRVKDNLPKETHIDLIALAVEHAFS